MIAEEYSNADSERIWKGIFMPHTLLGKSDIEKKREAQQQLVMQQSGVEAQQEERKKKGGAKWSI